LFFSEIATTGYNSRFFDVEIQGKKVLNNYSIFHDSAKIVEFVDPSNPGGPVVSLDATEAQRFTGVAKRFAVDVGSAGLEVDLKGEGDTKSLINGIRILRADAPRVENVVVKGTGWAKGVDYSFAEVVAAGNQHRPMYLQNANQIEVHFDGPVNLSNAQLDILGTNRAVIKTTANPSPTITLLNYNPSSFVATWSLNSALSDGKYALKLSGVKGSGGVGLDGDWTNFDGANATSHTPDDFGDDKKVQLLSGTGTPGNAFAFHFSVLPGDYNQDGIVDPAVDPLPGTLKDGTGDGQVDSADSAIVTNVYPLRQLPFRVAGGDYSDSERVDGADYTVWRTNWGNSVPVRFTVADGNGDFEIGSADYPLWRMNLGKSSAWYMGPGSGTMMTETIVDFGNAPQVTNVTISGSASTHSPYSFATHVGSGEQLKTVPVGGADTISIAFSEDVNVVASDLYVVGLRTANVPSIVDFDYDIGTMTATWRFANLFSNDQYAISLSDAVTDIEGNNLDGEWTNPAATTTTNSLISVFPSGDGSAGGRFDFAFTIMAGDANRNNLVDGTDYGIVTTNNWNHTANAQFTQGDFTGDGQVENPDFDVWTAEYLKYNNFTTLEILGDLNGDFVVDEADANTIADHLGMSNPTYANGDLNGDGHIDATDLNLIFAQYGLKLSVVS
jgi:hypothetical protein